MIAHGAWGGGWEWTPVARLLREHGHDVFTPTLTGMGERAHLGRDEPAGLGTHIDDIVRVLEFEDLHDVVLCGASYGGMPVTGAADRVPARIRLVVYIDALLPSDGQAALDLLPGPFAEEVRAGLKDRGPAWRIPIPPPLLAVLVPPGSLPEDIRAGYLARLRDHPAASLAEPLHLTGVVERLPRAFVRCTRSDLSQDVGDPIEACAARARAEGWVYRELVAPHDPQLFDPSGTAMVLAELAEAAGASA